MREHGWDARGADPGSILKSALDCVILMDATGRVVDFNPAAERTFGYGRDDVIGRALADVIIPPALREVHRAGLARYLRTGEERVLNRRVEVTAIRSDGSEFPVELTVTRVAGSEPVLFAGYLRDISDRVRSEQLRNVRLAATQNLAHARDAQAAVSGAIGAVCEQLGWELGAFWRVDASGEALVYVAGWNGEGEPIAGFEQDSAKRRFVRGEGLPGRVWEQGEPVWLPDVRSEANFPRREAAAAAGVRSAFGCPIAAGGRLLGVIEFVTRNLREPQADLLETLATVCAQLAQFIDRQDAQERLGESEARFRALMDQAPFSVQIFAPDGRTLRVNRAWSELWGVQLEDIRDYNVLHDPQLEEKGVAPLLRRAFAGEPVAIPPIRYDPNETLPDRTRHPDAARVVSAVAYPLKDEGGRVREVVLVHEDITARRRAETALRESEEKLRLLADTIPQLAWMARGDGFIFWYNRRWYEYTGTTPEDMEGWGWQSVHDPAVLPEVLERWKASIATGAPFDMVFPLKGADGLFRPFLTRVNPLRGPDGSILYWFGTNTDVSDIKRMEEALRDADRRKDEFLATLAHELRNPLAPIVNALQILNVGGAHEAATAQARVVMERQVRHLVRLVDDLLDMSRIARGKIELRRERVDLAPIVAQAVETAQPALDARGHRVAIALPQEPVHVHADPVRLVQVVGNLLTNAARYTQPGGHVSLTVKRTASRARIEVADTGMGIETDMLSRIFEPFVQGGEAGRDSHGGLGIGLALVKSIVEMHGGSVAAESEGVGRGARFIIELPLLASPPPAVTRADDAPPALPADPRRVLVVDDNRDAADSLAALLRMHGHDVEVAYGGESAVARALAFDPDFVLLDLGMPGIDGYETARRLRTLPTRRAPTLVALTGWGLANDREKTAAAGFDRHLVKPPDHRELSEILAMRPGQS